MLAIMCFLLIYACSSCLVRLRRGWSLALELVPVIHVKVLRSLVALDDLAAEEKARRHFDALVLREPAPAGGPASDDPYVGRRDARVEDSFKLRVLIHFKPRLLASLIANADFQSARSLAGFF